ncbi:hypothetical protein [Phaeacidiphilus oryzae]|uniref:hypothetical protein n=1 Tax=Phaeacidiphilus oryzae TaxID=348818 RepID=UPI00126A0D09|nr:hypothetical protein [Phaeacidiphilus oryzae]
MIISRGGRRAAIRTDESSAVYVGTHVARCERAGPAEPVRAVRAVVELSRALGGMTMRALLGAEFSPDPSGSATEFEVPFDEPLGLGAVAHAHCRSELGRSLVAGLPGDFAAAVLDGLAGEAAARTLPRGLLRIDRAGFDEAGSSEMAFKLAGGLLRCVVEALLHGDDPLVAAQAVVSGW